MKLGTKVGLGHRQIVLNRDPELSFPKGAQPPIFGHVCCGQTAAWMQLGTDVGLLDERDPALPLPKGNSASNFRPMPVVAKRIWMDQDATW